MRCSWTMMRGCVLNDPDLRSWMLKKLSEFNVQGSRFNVQGLTFKIQGSRFLVQSSRFKVSLKSLAVKPKIFDFIVLRASTTEGRDQRIIASSLYRRSRFIRLRRFVR